MESSLCASSLLFGCPVLLYVMPPNFGNLLPSTLHRIRTDQISTYKTGKLALLSTSIAHQTGSTTLPRARQALASIARTTEQGVRQLATNIYRQPPGQRIFTPTRTAEQYPLPMEWIQANREKLGAIAAYFRKIGAREPAQLATALSHGNLKRANEGIRETSKRIEAQLHWIAENSRIYQRYQDLIQQSPALGREGTMDDFDQTFKLDGVESCDEVVRAAADLFLSALAALELALRYKRYGR